MTMPSGGGIPVIPYHDPVTSPGCLKPERPGPTTLPVTQSRCSNPCIRLFCAEGYRKDNNVTARMHRKRKLTAVCSHQTRIGNLDAHLI
ncbi:hypothetical protein CCZ14_27680 [Escherichia coli]|nr:hypothetical protein CCZ14_27680 [Escherichia coli]RAX57362.1 hypothetical protein CCZ16_29180 [Escherichia coli]RAX72775.1 hypothetical protein CCZ17_27965 [Escherichia coli]RAX88725.1 hypothetical protein CCZ18_27515 [Escherichia coli]